MKTTGSPNVPRWVLAATILGSGMTFIDGTVVNVVLPVLGQTLHASEAQLQWIVEAYMLLLTSLMLLGGSLGDRYGRRRLFVVGTSLFALASAWCGLSPNVTSLIAGRAVQGIGAALLVPGSLAMISAAFDDRTRGAAIGTWASGTAICAGAGPVLGSLLVEHLSWRWVFLINLPLAIIALWIAWRHLPQIATRTPRTPLDWRGAALATLGLGALVFGLVRAGSLGFRDAVAAGASGGGALLLVAFVLVERWLGRRDRDAAMMPLWVFASRTFVGVNVLTIFLYGALAMALFVLPFTLIGRHGYTVVTAATAMLPFVIVMFLLSRWAGRLMDRYGARLPLVAGPLIAGAGYLLMTRVAASGDYLTAVLPAVLTMSVGMSIAVAPLTATVMAAVDQPHAGIASGINNATARLASLLAVALVGVLAPGAFAESLGQVALIAAGLAGLAALSALALVRPSR
jgi:EmrB/QacA subfamily drug resistance transporter